MDGTFKELMNLCPATIQQILKKRTPCRQFNVSSADFVASNFLPLVNNEKETSISFLGSKTSPSRDVNIAIT
jgi:hypothetical protein